MGYAWHMPEIAPEKDIEKLSPWLFVALFMTTHIVGFVWRVMLWPTGKAVDHTFWLGLLLPTIVWAILSCLIMARRELHQHMVTCWNIERQRYAACRQQWAQHHCVVAEVTMVTPEPELAERLLGLDGSPPENPGKTLPLILADDGKADRVTQLLTQLLTPLEKSIRAADRIMAPRIFMHGGSPEDEPTLDRIWNNLKLPAHSGVAQLKPETSLLHVSQQNWLAPVSVVLSYQLWNGDEDTPTHSELGAGLVVIAPEIADRLKLQVRTMLLRPIEATAEQVDQSLTTLVQSGQTDWAGLKHVWISGLGKPMHHAARAALQDTAPKTNLHDLDKAIGKPGVANAWLLQALAAQMVRHGQGDQMVVCTHADHAMSWNIVSARLLPPSPVEASGVRILSTWFLGVLAFFCAAAGCLVAMNSGISAAFLPHSAAFFGIGIIAQILLTVFVSYDVGKQFWRKAML